MVAEPEVLVASVESTSDRKVCPELALWRGWGGMGQAGTALPPARHRQHPGPTPLPQQHGPLQALDLIQSEVEDAGQVVVGAPGRGEVTLSQKQAHSSLPGTGPAHPSTATLGPGPPLSFPRPWAVTVPRARDRGSPCPQEGTGGDRGCPCPQEGTGALPGQNSGGPRAGQSPNLGLAPRRRG